MDKIKVGSRSAPAFTPGPWAVGFSDGSGKTYITAGDHPARNDVPVVVVSGAEDDWGFTHGVQNPDDARLIAAAPELYSALRAFVAAVEDDVEPLPGTKWYLELTAARAALAKAVAA